MTNKNQYTVNELAQHYEVPTSSVYSWIKKGKLNATRNNGKLIIIKDKLLLSFISALYLVKICQIEVTCIHD